MVRTHTFKLRTTPVQFVLLEPLLGPQHLLDRADAMAYFSSKTFET